VKYNKDINEQQRDQLEHYKASKAQKVRIIVLFLFTWRSRSKFI